MGTSNLSSDLHFSTNHLLQLAENSGAISAGFDSTGFQGFEPGDGNSLFFNRSKLLKRLENFSSVGAQPTLFQKRAALRKNLADSVCNFGLLGNVGGFDRREVGEVSEKKRKNTHGDDLYNLSFDGSGLNYDSDEFTENNMVEERAKNGGNSSNANSNVTGGDQKGKKKGLPAKNLMAERGRRKKLNDRLYMLRSVVPKISKACSSLESTPTSSSLTQSTSFYPLTPTPPHLPYPAVLRKNFVQTCCRAQLDNLQGSKQG